MTAILFDDFRSEIGFTPDITALKVMRVEAPGARLDAAYELLARVFDPAVVDSKETYVDLLSPDGLCLDAFPVICVAAYFDCQGDELLAGFLSSNLMWIDRAGGMLQLAIGNIATSPALVRMTFRGVGSALLESATAIAAEIARLQSGELAYSITEAEKASLGFWQKSGYLRPSGLRYLQPPLEFDANGSPIHSEVPETFLVRPLGHRRHDTIDTALLRQMILATYRNWCIDTNRQKLSAGALRNAEAYVMQHVFPQVAETIPDEAEIKMTAVQEDEERAVERRTIATSSKTE